MTEGFTAVAPDKLAVDRYAGLSAGSWRWIVALALIALAAVLPFAVSNYHVFELTLVMIYAIAVLGLNILTGYNGQISLGHGAFFAAGAYTAAILMHHYGVPYWATVPPAALICFALGVLFGLPALRFEGPYLALVTLAMALAMPQLLKYFDTWTGGQQGINLVKPVPPASLGIDRDRWLYLVVLAVLLVAMRIAANMLHGRTGRAFVAIRDQPIAAAAMGIHTARYKTLAFGTSTLLTGVAGALAAIVIGYVSPEGYSLFLSISFLVGSAVGGIATIGGAIVGGLFIQFVPNFANDISDAAPGAIYGLAMLLFMYAMPRGVVGSLGPWLARSMQQVHRLGFRRK
ncbi:MAG TPA: branched-chain amino acid ABC transporter permease [Xanthobacteraceae bacterium]|nr:branched-chain amino acid ABC transporter permease [Xanthobacteraceae bacterium]